MQRPEFLDRILERTATRLLRRIHRLTQRMPTKLRAIEKQRVGLVVAFGLTEVVMVVACVWLVPRGAFALGTLVDFVRALAAGAATLAVFWWFPPVTPWLGLPASIFVFAFFSLASASCAGESSPVSWHV